MFCKVFTVFEVAYIPGSVSKGYEKLKYKQSIT